MKNFTLMILCAGFGSRMLNLTRSTPKPLLKYKNKVLLKNTIDFFTNIGCDEILINTHYLHHKIKKYLNKNFKKYPIQIIYEKNILGTGGGVKNIFNHTKRNIICVVNSDIFWTKTNKSNIEYFYDNTSIIENFNTFLEQYYVLSLARQTRLLGRWRKLLSTNNDNQYLDYLKITKSRAIATLNNIKNYELRSLYEKYL